METLIEKFVEACQLAISEMLSEEADADYCEEVYSKYRSIFLMIDMVKLVTQKNQLPASLVNRMKELVEDKLAIKK